MTRRPPAGYVKLGRLGRSFKLSGGVRLHLDNAYLLDESEQDMGTDALDALGRLFVAGLGETRLRDHEYVSGSVVIYLEGVRDRTVARSLVNAEVWAETSDLPPGLEAELTAPSPEDELVGLAVTLNGVKIGTVGAATLGTVNDYVEAHLDAGGTALLPLTAPYVLVTEDGVKLTDPPDGLFDA